MKHLQAQKSYFLNSKHLFLFLPNHFCAAYFEQMSRCVAPNLLPPLVLQEWGVACTILCASSLATILGISLAELSAALASISSIGLQDSSLPNWGVYKVCLKAGVYFWY